MNQQTSSRSAFHVPLADHLLARCVHRARPLWIALGNLESASLRSKLDAVEIDRPVYVTGLARGGTTILLEYLAQHAKAAAHRYSDYCGIFVPYWWGKSQRGDAAGQLHERAHGDGIQVTPDSPEAMEECLWMAFFRNAHNPAVSNVLTADVKHAKFERFYRDHIRKLLLGRERTRYVCKGNYNLTRLEYLRGLFPDARFVVAVRHPADHVASLRRQHERFCAAEAEYPRALAYMQQAGHFEFGLDRRPIHVGNGRGTQDIQTLWRRGEEVRGLARYWSHLYGWLAEVLQQDEQLGAAVQVVRFEDLCRAAEPTLTQIAQHCDLFDTEHVARFAQRIHAPRNPRQGLTAEDELIIAEETEDVAYAFGYSSEGLVAASVQASLSDQAIPGQTAPCEIST